MLDDVVEGYMSIVGAERDYGVMVRYLGGVNQILRLPGDYELDIAATGPLRASLATAGGGLAA